MATLEDNANSYFASMSHLASKMIEYNESIKDMYSDTWAGLSWEKQEELLDKHLFDFDVAERYSSYGRSEELPNCFPVLKINSGEKIVVDFDHDDGWTWTDEHSAPFSWKTKSQQDLTLADYDDSGNLKEEQQGKKSRVGKKSRSPDRSVFESMAAAGDKNKNEVEKMFEKFGIKGPGYSDDDDEAEDRSHPDVIVKDAESTISPSHLYNERSKLLEDSGERTEHGDSLFRPEMTSNGIDRSKKNTSKQNSAAAVANGTSKTTTARESKGKAPVPKKEKMKADEEKSKQQKPEKKKKKVPVVAESDDPSRKKDSCVPNMTNFSTTSSNYDENARYGIDRQSASAGATMSPTFFPEIGESTTDAFPDGSMTALDSENLRIIEDNNVTDDVFELENYGNDVNVVTTQPKKFNPEVNLDYSADEPIVVSMEEPVAKTGFDFLDDW